MSINRITIAVCALLVLAAGAVGALAQSQLAESEVRISARQLEDGRIEFALQPRDGDGWGERLLPAQRKFPAEPGHDRWLYSSPLDVFDEFTIRIAARRLEDGRTEFALQPQQGAVAGRWGDLLLPSSRFFPVSVDVDRWLNSSPLDLEELVLGPVPQGVPIHAPDGVALERADLDGWSYNGLEWSFYYGTDVDPLTDHVRTWINKVVRTDDDLYDTIRLQIACEDDGDVSTMLWEDSLPYQRSDRSVSVSWRVDGGEVVSEHWRHYSGGNDGVHASARFAAVLPTADVVVVQIGFHSRTLTARFTNVSDMFRTRVQPNIEFCGRY